MDADGVAAPKDASASPAGQGGAEQRVEQRGLAGVREADQAGVGDRLELEQQFLVLSRLAAQRDSQAREWLVQSLRERFGREGLKHAGALALKSGQSPFDVQAEMSRWLGAFFED